jgi:hypothetical protein
MIKIKVSKTNNTKNPRRPTRKQRRMLLATAQPAHPYAKYIIHQADASGWRGISRVPRSVNVPTFQSRRYQLPELAWTYIVGECKTVYAYEGTSTNAMHTVVLNNGDTFTCTTMADVKQELRKRLA